MNRERVLKVVLALVGLLFTAGIYPIAMTLWQRDQNGYTDAMMLSIYFTLGIFLLNAARNPSANRILIAFTAWSSFAHALVMTIMAFQTPSDRELLWGVAIFAVIGFALMVLAPPKHSGEQLSAAA